MDVTILSWDKWIHSHGKNGKQRLIILIPFFVMRNLLFTKVNIKREKFLISVKLKS